MGVAVARPAQSATVLPGRRYDHVFFSFTVSFMVLAVVVGFGPTYYFAGLLKAPLPSVAIHVHAVLFTSWIVLLAVQSVLVSTHRVALHRRLGIAGGVLAGLMVPVGVWAGTDSLIRPPVVAGRDPLAFYIVPLSSIFVFGVLVAFAFHFRRDSATHKRLILLATSATMVAAFTRWPIAAIHRQVFRAGFVSDIFLLLLVCYDLWSLRKIHRATLWAGAFLLVVQQGRFVVAQTAAWHAFASWAQALYR